MPDQPNGRRPTGETLPPTGPRPTPEPALVEIPAPDRTAEGRRAAEDPSVRPGRSRTPTEPTTARPGPDAGPHPDGPPAEAGETVAVRRPSDPQLATQQVAHEEGTSRSEPMPVASQPTTLPRLQPHSWPDPDQAPEVTVNIGRIEVLPPRTTEPKRPPATSPPPRRATGAPDLADYLRERGRR